MPPPSPKFRPFELLTGLTDAPDSALLKAERGQVEITAAGPGCLRVRATPRRRLPPHQSLALAGPPPAAPLRLEPAGGNIQVLAEGVWASVQPEPLCLAFGRAPGQPPFMAEVLFGTRGQFVVARAALPPEAHVYGLGEKTGWLDRRRRRYRMRNTDVLLEYKEGIGIATDPLYASFPVFIVHSRAGSYGVFVDNPEFTTFDFALPEQKEGQDAYEFAAPAAVLTFFVLAGPTLPDVVRQYTALTGRPPLPALWTLGYHQCRWGYRTEAEFRAVAEELRARDLPADALWFDIDHMDGYRVFTWDRRRFPRPARLVADLKEMGLRSVTIVDPGVKVDPKYDLYRQGQAGGHFVTHADGSEYHGSVWPGRCAFPDFHSPTAAAWWAGRVRTWAGDNGLGGIWIDMNEPASTDLSGPLTEALHADGRLPHPAARNTYALEMARATAAGLRALDPDGRPFVLTRAAFSGIQTVAALWCGDNSPHWEHLAGSLPMLLNLGLSGMPFVGVDIGGFAGDTHGELLARWFQAGAFYPFCRNHAMAGTNPHEPWAFGPAVEAICRRYLQLRYSLLPYTYCLWREAAQTGAPLMRPLVWHYPNDPLTYNLSDQFLYGPDLLVAPVAQPGQTARAVYLPRGRWHRWGSDEAFDGPGHIAAPAPLEELPLFVRGGALVPMWPPAAHTGLVQPQRLSLHIWPGQGRLDFYEDDGATLAYTRGEFRLTPFRLRQRRDGTLSLAWGPSTGDYPSPRRQWTFVFHEAPGSTARLDGQPVPARRARNTLTVRANDDGDRHVLTLAG